MAGERDVLAVATEAEPEELFARIGSNAEPEALRVHIVVPATPPRHTWTYTEGGAEARARVRLRTLLAWARARGVTASGEVGDSNPCTALREATRGRRYDKVVLLQRPSFVDRLASV